MELSGICPWDANPLGKFVVCPKCDEDHVHLRHLVQVDQTEDRSLIYVTLSLECEQGHEFELIFSQDHGLLYADVRRCEPVQVWRAW